MRADWRRRARDVVGIGGTALLAAAGCRGRQPAQADAQTRPAGSAALPASPATAPRTLAAGTPAGGLRDWIADVRRGLSAVPLEAVGDPVAAQKAALDLYLTRQEYIEMYWGVAGRLTRGAALGPAVKEAETRFHLVLGQIRPGRPVDAAALRAGIRSLSAQYDRVLSAAAAAGVAQDPHAVFSPAAGSGAAPTDAAGSGAAPLGAAPVQASTSGSAAPAATPAPASGAAGEVTR